MSNYAHLKVAEEQNDKTTGKARSLLCLPSPNLIPNWAYITQCLHQNNLAKTSTRGRITQLSIVYSWMLSDAVITGGPFIPATHRSGVTLLFHPLVSDYTFCVDTDIFTRGKEGVRRHRRPRVAAEVDFEVGEKKGRGEKTQVLLCEIQWWAQMKGTDGTIHGGQEVERWEWRTHKRGCLVAETPQWRPHLDLQPEMVMTSAVPKTVISVQLCIHPPAAKAYPLFLCPCCHYV